MENLETVGGKDSTEEQADECTPVKQMKTEEADDQVKPEATAGVESGVRRRDATDNEECEQTEEERKAAILERLKRQGVRSMFGGPMQTRTAAADSSGDQPLAAVENKPRRTQTMPPNPFLAELSKKIGAETSPSKKAAPPVAPKVKPKQDTPADESKDKDQDEAPGEADDDPGSFWQPISSGNQPNESSTDVELPSFDAVPHDGLLNIRMQKERATGPRRKGTVKQALGGGAKPDSELSIKSSTDVPDCPLILADVTTTESDVDHDKHAETTREEDVTRQENVTDATATTHATDDLLGLGSSSAQVQTAVEVQSSLLDVEITESKGEDVKRASYEADIIEKRDGGSPGLMEVVTSNAGPSSLSDFELIEPEPSPSELISVSLAREDVKQPSSLTDWSLLELNQNAAEGSENVGGKAGVEAHTDVTSDWVQLQPQHESNKADSGAAAAASDIDLLSDWSLPEPDHKRHEEEAFVTGSHDIQLEVEPPFVESCPDVASLEAQRPQSADMDVSNGPDSPVVDEEDKPVVSKPSVSNFDLLLDISGPSSEIKVSDTRVVIDAAPVVTDHSTVAEQAEVRLVDDLLEAAREEKPPAVTMTALQQLDVTFTTTTTTKTTSSEHSVNTDSSVGSTAEVKLEDAKAVNGTSVERSEKPAFEKVFCSDEERKETPTATDADVCVKVDHSTHLYAENQSDLFHEEVRVDHSSLLDGRFDEVKTFELQSTLNDDASVGEKRIDAPPPPPLHRMDSPVERHREEHDSAIVTDTAASAAAVDADNDRKDEGRDAVHADAGRRRPSLQINSKDVEDVEAERPLASESFVLKQHSSGELEIKFDLGGVDNAEKLKLPGNDKAAEDSPPPPLPSSPIPNFPSVCESASHRSSENHEPTSSHEPPVKLEKSDDVVAAESAVNTEDKGKNVELSPTKGSQRGAMYKLIQVDLKPVKRAPEKDKENSQTSANESSTSAAKSSDSNAYVQQRLGLRASPKESSASTGIKASTDSDAYLQQRMGLRRVGTIQDQDNEVAKEPVNVDRTRRKSETPYNRFAGSTTPTYRASALQPVRPAAGGWTPLRSCAPPKSPTVTVSKPSQSSSPAVNLLDERRKLKKIETPEANATDNGSDVSTTEKRVTPIPALSSPLRVTIPVLRQSSRDVVEDQLKSPAFLQEWDRIRQQRQLRSPSAKSVPSSSSSSSRDSESPVPEFKKLAAQLTKRHAAIADAEVR